MAGDVALPIVFVHGFAGSAQQYESQKIRFVANGYPAERIVAFQSGVDVFMPASPDGSGTITVTNLPRGCDEATDPDRPQLAVELARHQPDVRRLPRRVRSRRFGPLVRYGLGVDAARHDRTSRG